MVFAFPLPPVSELGNAQGVDFELIDRGGAGTSADGCPEPIDCAWRPKTRDLTSVRPNGMEDVPEYRVDVDWDKAGAGHSDR